MANYKTVELILVVECLWCDVYSSYMVSMWCDVYSSYMVSSNPEYMWCVVFEVHMLVNTLLIKIHHKIKVHLLVVYTLYKLLLFWVTM